MSYYTIYYYINIPIHCLYSLVTAPKLQFDATSHPCSILCQTIQQLHFWEKCRGCFHDIRRRLGSRLMGQGHFANRGCGLLQLLGYNLVSELPNKWIA